MIKSLLVPGAIGPGEGDRGRRCNRPTAGAGFCTAFSLEQLPVEGIMTLF
jgi:hypothetical protein